MTNLGKTNPYMFAAKKANFAAGKNFMQKVSKDAGLTDTRETGASSFKQVFNNTKNQVQVEFESLEKQTLSPYKRPGTTHTAFRTNA